MREILTQCFRGYAAIGVIAAGITALWTLGVVEMAIPLIGYAWFIVAAAGTVVAVGLATKHDEVVEPDAAPDRIETFEDATVTGRPFELYIAALAAWAAVSFGWVLGGMSVEAIVTIGGVSASGLVVVGYGWLAIALYGVVVGISIAMNHREDVATVVDPADSLKTDS